MRSLTALVLLAVCAHAPAQTVYKWVDENGETHYSQTLPPERVRQEHVQLDGEGRVTHEVERALTSEERAELARRMRAERDEAQRQRLQAQEDRLFLATYPTEEALVDSTESQRRMLMTEFESVDSLIEQARTRLNQSVSQAASMQRGGRDVPEHIRDDIARARINLSELNVRLGEIQDEIDGLDEELAASLARYRRLTGTAGDAADTEADARASGGGEGTG